MFEIVRLNSSTKHMFDDEQILFSNLACLGHFFNLSEFRAGEERLKMVQHSVLVRYL